jgi:hypothetical protein
MNSTNFPNQSDHFELLYVNFQAILRKLIWWGHLMTILKTTLPTYGPTLYSSILQHAWGYHFLNIAWKSNYNTSKWRGEQVQFISDSFPQPVCMNAAHTRTLQNKVAVRNEFYSFSRSFWDIISWFFSNIKKICVHHVCGYHFLNTTRKSSYNTPNRRGERVEFISDSYSQSICTDAA